MKFAILIAAAMIAFLGWRVAELERQRYALFVGMCDRDPLDPLPWIRCVARENPRTSQWWNLYYGVTG